MTDPILAAAASQAAHIRTRLKRFKLVFIQCGSMFDVFRNPLLTALGGRVFDAADFTESESIEELAAGPVILCGLESFARDGKVGGATLGKLRIKVNELRDNEVEICLISRAPKMSFAPVPGSNLLLDASWHCLPLLEPHVAIDDRADADSLLRKSLEELGLSVLSDLDFAIFEANHDASFITDVAPDVADALLGAGLAHVVDEAVEFISPGPFWKFKNALADVIAAAVAPQAELHAVAEDLWQIERTIRKALRETAINASGSKWRKNVFNEAIADNVLERARKDVYVTARSVSELRDPIEWLSLGELLEVVQSTRFEGLAWDEMTWKRFASDVMPIRNRLSHMRLLKKGDRITVRMWLNRAKNTWK